MFKRRKPLTKLQHLRELCWPSMGWRRAFRYIYLRISRLTDSEHSIALGLAIGAGTAFNPLIGTHMLQGAFFAWLFRANVLSALIGSFFGNPWTYPFIWWAAIVLGSYVMGLFGVSAANAAPADMDWRMLLHIVTHEPLRLFTPWMLGGYALGLLFALATYGPIYSIVKMAKTARRKAKLYAIWQAGREATQERGESA